MTPQHLRDDPRSPQGLVCAFIGQMVARLSLAPADWQEARFRPLGFASFLFRRVVLLAVRSSKGDGVSVCANCMRTRRRAAPLVAGRTDQPGTDRRRRLNPGAPPIGVKFERR
jgi:hypothetical protein